MSGFLIYDHYPSINEQEIPRNPTVKVYFNQEISLSSIDYQVISIHDNLYTTIPGTVSHDYTEEGTPSGIANVLTITPTILLNADSKYSVFVHKAPNSVISTNSDNLGDTYKFSFFTGSGTVAISEPTTLEQLAIDLQHAIDREDWSLADEIQILIDTYGSGVIPSGIVDAPTITEALAVTVTYPDDKAANVSLSDLKFIRIGLNDAPDISGTAMGDYIDLTYRGVLY